jgi:hypothetical protein
LAQVPGAAPVLLASACAALALNLSIYLLIAATSALTLNVAGVRHEPSTVKCEGRAEKEEPLAWRRLFPKLAWSILGLFCPMTLLQLLGLRHRRYPAPLAWQTEIPTGLQGAFWTRAVGKLFVVPAGALPLPVFGRLYEAIYRQQLLTLCTVLHRCSRTGR